MKYVFSTELLSSVKELQKRGGQFKKAADTIFAIMGRINTKEPEPFSGVGQTYYGESRIKHCSKYDLAGNCRLVTVCHSDFTFLLYAGVHEEVDKWLKRNSGKEFIVNEKNELVATLKPSEITGGQDHIEPREKNFEAAIKLFDRLPDEPKSILLDQVSGSVGISLSSLTITSSEDALLEISSKIDNKVISDAVLDVLIALISNDIKEAEARVKLMVGEYYELEDVDEVNEGKDLKFVPTDSPEWATLFQHFARTSGYKEWMLFLHPDQSATVEENFNGPSKLLGVSGSGKTCVVVKRAIRLASTYSDKQILILTLNPALSNLIDELVTEASTPELREQIMVKPFFELCQMLIYRFEPGSEIHYSDVSWKSEEHIDAVWREFYRCDLNNYDAAVMQPVHDSLIAQGIDGETYIREEFDWIRSAIARNDRNAYLELERKGRSFPLQRQQRQLLLSGLAAWEQKMKAVGVIDVLGLVAALQPYLNQIEPAFRSILVDESQDFGTSELEIIRKLATPNTNDLFLCGDAAQRVSSKYQKYHEAGIEIPGARSRQLLKNYRNSKEILTAAYEVLQKNINAFHIDSDEFEVLDPFFADFSGPTPLILSASNYENEIGNALAFATDEVAANRSWKACIAFSGHSLYEIQAFSKRLKMPLLDGSRSIDEHAIYFSDLAQTKGFEFDLMVVVNVCDNVLPNPNSPEMEQAKDLAQLYVAMTRAKNQLVLSHHGTPSRLLNDMHDAFLVDTWATYNDRDVDSYGIPPKLSQLDLDSLISENIAELDGPQFLYTEHAIGLPVRLIENIRNKVGRSDTSNSKLTVSVDMGYVHERTLTSPRARVAFGRESSKDLQKLGLDLKLSKLHRQRLE
jgi:hypothetical protein